MPTGPDPEARELHADGGFAAEVVNCPKGMVPSFRLWHYPPEGPWRTWVLFVTSPPETGLVREMVWDRAESFTKDEAPVDEEKLRSVLLRAGRLALYGDDLMGASRLSEFGIEGYAHPNSPDRVTWDRPVPPELRTIAAWFSRTRAAFESCFP